ncbi:hypothetical protein FS749_001960 [Ceratobasidium sp. UAMH 11750]|nr:hypothetical protein FS749_001960 [Ceratobasidium sp. UAMH 11750]
MGGSKSVPTIEVCVKVSERESRIFVTGVRGGVLATESRGEPVASPLIISGLPRKRMAGKTSPRPRVKIAARTRVLFAFVQSHWLPPSFFLIAHSKARGLETQI